MLKWMEETGSLVFLLNSAMFSYIVDHLEATSLAHFLKITLNVN